MGAGLCSQVTATEREGIALSCARGVQVGCFEKIILPMSGDALAESAQGGGGLNVPGDVQE